MKTGVGKAVHFLWAQKKFYFRVYRKRLWHFESKERLGKVCKLVQYKIFCLVVHTSWHMTSTCYRALPGKSFMKKLTSQTGVLPFLQAIDSFRVS